MLSFISLKKWCWAFCLTPILLFSQNATFELRGGYFYPLAETVREVYHNGGGEGEVEASKRIYDSLSVWGNFNLFFKKGHSVGLDNGTFLRLFPLSAGLKYAFHLVDSFDFYLGVGPSYTWIKIHDYSPYVQTRTFRQTWGVVGKAGFLYFFPGKRFFLDVYSDYYYTDIARIHRAGIESSDRDLGGFRIGGGLGVSF